MSLWRERTRVMTCCDGDGAPGQWPPRVSRDGLRRPDRGGAARAPEAARTSYQITGSSPIRPQPGSLIAGRRTSRPAIRPRKFTSMPSIHPIATPRNPRGRAGFRCGSGQSEKIHRGLPVLADRGRRRRELGDGAHDMRHEGVGVRTRPGPVIAPSAVGIRGDRVPDFHDQPRCIVPFDDEDRLRRIAEPAAVRGQPSVRTGLPQPTLS